MYSISTARSLEAKLSELVRGAGCSDATPVQVAQWWSHLYAIIPSTDYAMRVLDEVLERKLRRRREENLWTLQPEDVRAILSANGW